VAVAPVRRRHRRSARGGFSNLPRPPDQSISATILRVRPPAGVLATVTAITKCPIQVQAVNGLTMTPRALNHHGRTGDWIGPFAGLMEKEHA
jgi:hypothetical protein